MKNSKVAARANRKFTEVSMEISMASAGSEPLLIYNIGSVLFVYEWAEYAWPEPSGTGCDYLRDVIELGPRAADILWKIDHLALRDDPF